LTIDAGIEALFSAANAMALAFSLPDRVEVPIVTSTGSPRATRRARSTSTPYRISVA